jgi:biotin-dependent carboxylase-like uncharacterized protein
MTALHVLRTGPLATVQDLGRPGYADLGVSPSGACDRGALRLANRLVGNQEDAAAIEVTAGGLAVRPTAPVLVVLTGAPVPVTVDGRPAALFEPVLVRAGQVLSLGRPVSGLRSYLAVRGGLDVPPVLGSRSTDLLSGIGPERLAEGMELPVGTASGSVPRASFVPAVALSNEIAVEVRLGPRHDWFTEAAVRRLTATGWEVSADSNRIGVRLTGPKLERSRTEELPSEGVLRGAIQVPASGQPLVFLSDHPTTGGYPVIAVVASGDVDKLGQARPGQLVRMTATAR